MKYLFFLSVPIAVLISFLEPKISYFAIIYAFVLIPLVELFFKGDESNLSLEEEESYKSNKFYDWLLYLALPLQLVLLIQFLFTIYLNDLSFWQNFGFITAMGTACGVIGINLAHELGHRKNKGEQFFAKALLLTSQYMHFFIEHNRIHHKMVSTPEDPASAQYNQNLYAFWLQSIIGNLRASFKIAPLETFLYQLIQGSLIISIYFLFDLKTMLAYLAAALFGILLLETVNYIEHYGLSRKKNLATGRYEKVTPFHSWNSNHPLGRSLLFELSRHSDHHANAQRKFQILRHFKESPQMPTGYPGMMVLSLFPPLWFKIMNPLVRKHNYQINFLEDKDSPSSDLELQFE